MKKLLLFAVFSLCIFLQNGIGQCDQEPLECAWDGIVIPTVTLAPTPNPDDCNYQILYNNDVYGTYGFGNCGCCTGSIAVDGTIISNDPCPVGYTFTPNADVEITLVFEGHTFNFEFSIPADCGLIPLEPDPEPCELDACICLVNSGTGIGPYGSGVEGHVVLTAFPSSSDYTYHWEICNPGCSTYSTESVVFPFTYTNGGFWGKYDITLTVTDNLNNCYDVTSNQCRFTGCVRKSLPNQGSGKKTVSGGALDLDRTSLNVFPNVLAQDETPNIQIENFDWDSAFTLTVFNLAGQKIYTASVQEPSFELSTKINAEGLFLFLLSDEKGIVDTQKVLFTN